MDAKLNNLVEETMILSHRLHWSGEYIESMPRLERQYALNEIRDIISIEQKEIQDIKNRRN